MKSSWANSKLIIAIFLVLCFILTACTSATTTSPNEISTVATEISDITATLAPTFTPTVAPVPTPFDYMLNAEDLPLQLQKSLSVAYLNRDGSVTYRVLFFDASIGSIWNFLTIAKEPYTSAPIIEMGTSLKDDLIAENARASFQDNGSNPMLYYEFYQDNLLVQINGSLSLQQAVELGKIAAARLPETLDVTPISFPDQLDESMFKEHLRSLIVQKQSRSGGNPVEASSFNVQDSFCLSVDSIIDVDKYAFAVYDVLTDQIVFEYAPEYSLSCVPFFGVFHSGAYEVWFTVNGTLVSKIPIEVQ